MPLTGVRWKAQKPNFPLSRGIRSCIHVYGSSALEAEYGNSINQWLISAINPPIYTHVARQCALKQPYTHLISVEEVQYLSSTAQHSISRKDNIGEHLYILACQAHPALVF